MTVSRSLSIHQFVQERIIYFVITSTRHYFFSQNSYFLRDKQPPTMPPPPAIKRIKPSLKLDECGTEPYRKSFTVYLLWVQDSTISCFQDRNDLRNHTMNKKHFGLWEKWAKFQNKAQKSWFMLYSADPWRRQESWCAFVQQWNFK